MDTERGIPYEGRAPGGGARKTSISITEVVHTRAIMRISAEGFRSFSDYVEFLIRRDTTQRRIRRRVA